MVERRCSGSNSGKKCKAFSIEPGTYTGNDLNFLLAKSEKVEMLVRRL